MNLNNANRLVSLYSEFGVTAPAALRSAIDRTIDLHAKFDNYAKPYQRGELADQLHAEILTCIDAGRDPAASSKVANLHARIQLLDENWPNRAHATATNDALAPLNDTAIQRDLFAALTTPAATAWEALAEAVAHLGYDYDPDSTDVLKRGTAKAAAWITARDTQEALRVVTEAWFTIRATDNIAAGTGAERALLVARPADGKDFAMMFRQYNFGNLVPRTWHEINRGDFTFYKAAQAGWVTDVATSVDDLNARLHAAHNWYEQHPVTIPQQPHTGGLLR